MTSYHSIQFSRDKVLLKRSAVCHGELRSTLLTPAAGWILLCGCRRMRLCRLCGLLPAGARLVLHTA